jgi:hypothetical protein
MRKGTDKSGAVFSECGKYRYSLWRNWNAAKPFVVFIGLNPSTAGAVEDDPTIRRCRGYAQAWDFGGMYVVNLFAFRATRPAGMKQAHDSVGPKNDRHLQEVVARAGMVVAIWGNHGAHLNRSEEVRGCLTGLKCLKLNKSGEPCHPLYLRKNLRPQPLRPARSQ